MGLGDLVDGKGGDSSTGGSSSSGSDDDEYSSRAWKPSQTGQRVGERLVDIVEEDGVQEGTTMVYRVLADSVKIKDGVVLGSDGEELVDISDTRATITTLDVELSVEDRTISKKLFEIRDRRPDL
jgi:hypothetical protein